MTAKDYKVSFGYLEKTTLNGRPYTHRGLDYATPAWTPLDIEGKTIGYTGNSGLTTGPHLHLQAGKDFWAQETINPSKYAFKGGKVVQTGNASEWGNYIIIQVGNIYVVYAHLAKISVKKGDIIINDMKPKDFKYGKPPRNIYEWASLALSYDKRIKGYQKDVSKLTRELEKKEAEATTQRILKSDLEAEMDGLRATNDENDRLIERLNTKVKKQSEPSSLTSAVKIIAERISSLIKRR